VSGAPGETPLAAVPDEPAAELTLEQRIASLEAVVVDQNQIISRLTGAVSQLMAKQAMTAMQPQLEAAMVAKIKDTLNPGGTDAP
jgi:uncharacterized coiled-coil protein SlyX